MRLSQVLGCTVVALVTAAAGGCGRAADNEERIEQFEEMLSEELGSEVKLRCPPMVDNTSHYCTAVVPDQDDLVFPVRVVSRGNELDYATKSWVFGKRMVKLGEHALQEKYDLAVHELKCPPISHMPDGATARCEAQFEGVTIPIEVSMVEKVRKLSFRPVGGVVFGETAARVAHERIHESGEHVEVTCPRTVIVSVPGKRFECEALKSDKTSITIHYLITDSEGGFELGTTPPEAGGAAAAEALEHGAGETADAPAEEVPT
jgi:hypothetical protein